MVLGDFTGCRLRGLVIANWNLTVLKYQEMRTHNLNQKLLMNKRKEKSLSFSKTVQTAMLQWCLDGHF